MYQNSKLEKDVQVGDMVSCFVSDGGYGGESYPAKCIANNGKTLKFELYFAPNALQQQFGRPLEDGGRLAYWGNWRIDIPFADNRESFKTCKEIFKRRISKKGYHMDVYTEDKLNELKFFRMGRDPNWN